MADDSDDKTEDPTQKRLDDAHARGDVAKSQEVNTWFVIAGATLVLSTFSGSIGGGILMPLRNLVANAGMLRADGAALLQLGNTLGIAVLAADRRAAADADDGGDRGQHDPAPAGVVGANRSSRNSARCRPAPASSACSASRRWRTSPRACSS